MMEDSARIRSLLARIRELSDELRDARFQIDVMQDALLAESGGIELLGMTKTERLLLGFLLKKKRASKQSIHQFLYADRSGGDAPEIKIVDVLVCKIRKKLPDGCEIKTRWGDGYELPSATVAALKDLASEQAEEAAA